MLAATVMENEYVQIKGGIESLCELETGSFDIILCHNVLEYVEDKDEILKEFDRLLKPEGFISVVKHNRAGRVMQMVVLLNDFEEAKNLLNGGNSMAKQFGEIKYYEDEFLTNTLKGYEVIKNYGIRTFWDLQQNQEMHKDSEWQDKMLEIEEMVSEIDEYREIAFFHHLILKKEFNPLTTT